MKDLAEAARKHYEEASLSVCHWSSTIPHAIDAWERQEQRLTSGSTFGVGTDV
jgi:hypothetical protein